MKMGETVDGQLLSIGDEDHDPQFIPIITLPEIVVNTLEEEEVILHRVRAKLFRHDKDDKEWKERGTGEAKLLLHEKNGTVRVLMRRDKTLKLCANHYVTSDMILQPNCGSDRAWVWSTPADATDGSPKPEILAMRFINADAAKTWKEKFEEAKTIVEINKSQIKNEDDSENDNDDDVSTSPSITDEEEADIVEKVQSLSIKNVNQEIDKEEVITKVLDKLEKDDKNDEKPANNLEIE